MNLCVSCGEDFASVDAFDSHRVGVHAYTYSEGLRFAEPVEDGRRCLDKAEMVAVGLALDGRGRWRDEAAAERVRRHHQKVAVRSGETRGGDASPESVAEAA